jgi:N-methylhydantoinase B
MAAGPSPIHRRTVVLQDILGGGMGARRGLDGLDAVDTHVSNCGLLSAEVCETLYSWRVERTELIPDSGGEGRYRGGLGIRRTYRALVGQDAVLYIDQTDPRFAPPGLAGGRAGAGARLAVSFDRRRWTPTKATLFVPEGGTITVETAGGGGWGVPARRDPEALALDVRDGMVTRRGARRYPDARKGQRQRDA